MYVPTYGEGSKSSINDVNDHFCQMLLCIVLAAAIAIAVPLFSSCSRLLQKSRLFGSFPCAAPASAVQLPLLCNSLLT